MRFVIQRTALILVAVLLAICFVAGVVGSEPNDEPVAYLPVVRVPPPPYPVWVNAYEGPFVGSASEVITTNDGGFVAVGTSSPLPGLVLKLDREGKIQWQKVHQIGGSITDVAEAGDGSLLAASLNSSYESAYVIKHRANGSVVWRRGLDTDSLGEVNSGDLDEVNGGAVLAFNMSYTSWVWRLNSNGDTAWKKQYGQDGNFQLESVRHTSDGGFIVAGQTTNYGAQNWDGWILKLNHDGSIAWQNIYGGEEAEYIKAIRQTGDGGYIAAGRAANSGWLLRLKPDGSVSWSKRIAIADEDEFYSVEETRGGGFIAVGETKSYQPYGIQGWTVMLNSSDQLDWQRLYDYGGLGLRSVEEVQVGGFVFAAMAGDAIVMRTDMAGHVMHCGLIGLGDGVLQNHEVIARVSTANPTPVSANSGNFNSYIDNGVVGRRSVCQSGAAVSDCPSE